MLLSTFSILLWVISFGRGKVDAQAPEPASCIVSLGIPKDPCPPCPNSTYTYLTSDTFVDQAVHTDAPHWYNCLERKEALSSSYGLEHADFNYIWRDPTNASNPPLYDVDVALIYQPLVPCGVQVIACPSEKKIKCEDKLMMAHEDSYRPHCDKSDKSFVQNYQYVLKKGQYDKDLAEYWLKNDPDFVTMDARGDLKIIYDFTTFGCPIQPYQEDEFAPDLRILTEDMHRNTSLGLRYNKSYVLIEIFGAKGYEYEWKTHPASKIIKCKFQPQTLKSMLAAWKSVPLTHHYPIRDPLLIWNKNNYQSCNETGRPAFVKGKEIEYQIMNNYDLYKNDTVDEPQINRIKWKDPYPQVLIFLAVAVDDDECEYYALFGVSLPKAEELDNFLSFLWFVAFTIIWILLVICGYYCRKSQIRKQYFEEARAERLKQSAWAVIYRYEKLLHETENKQLEKEMTDYSHSVEKDKGGHGRRFTKR